MSILGTASRLVPRIVISALVGLGLVYFVLIAITFNQYGEKIDKQWSRSMTDMRMSSFGNLSNSYMPSFGNLSSSYGEFPAPGFAATTIMTMPPTAPVIIRSSISSSSSRRRSRSPDKRRERRGRRRSRSPDRKDRSRSYTPVDRSSSISPPSFKTISTPPSLASEYSVIPPLRYGIPIVPRDGSMHKVVGLWFNNHDKYPMPAISRQRGLSEEQWELFVFVSNCIVILVQVG